MTDRRAIALEAQNAAAAAKASREAAASKPKHREIIDWNALRESRSERIPEIVYNCPMGRWVNHPVHGHLVLYHTMKKAHRDMYDDKNGVLHRDKGPQIMRDIDPFVSPIDGRIINTRPDIRDHEQRHDVIQVGDVNWDDEQVRAPEPDDAHFEQEAATALEKLEQGYWRDNPNRDNDDAGFASSTDEGLRRGHYAR